jgi:2-polyprenyl-3-methyl-5-hydroxy-6-metoxy-1,4-benzoquinol methylase
LEWTSCNYCSSDATEEIYDYSPLKIVRCKRCGLVYTNPRLDAKTIHEQLYDANYWRVYEDCYRTDLPAARQFCNRWLDKLEHYVDKQNWKICEIGPGLGLFLAEARNRGHEVYGVELSRYAINYAKNRFSISSICEADADMVENLGFQEMDAVVMFATIEHLRDPSSVLRRINHCLSDGGLLLLSTGVWGSFNQRVAGRAWSIVAPEGHLYYFSKQTIRRMLDKLGFTVLELETNSALVNPLTRNRLLVAMFNNRFVRPLGVIAQVLRLGDEMFIISKKTKSADDHS